MVFDSVLLRRRRARIIALPVLLIGAIPELRCEFLRPNQPRRNRIRHAEHRQRVTDLAGHQLLHHRTGGTGDSGFSAERLRLTSSSGIRHSIRNRAHRVRNIRLRLLRVVGVHRVWVLRIRRHLLIRRQVAKIVELNVLKRRGNTDIEELVVVRVIRASGATAQLAVAARATHFEVGAVRQRTGGVATSGATITESDTQVAGSAMPTLEAVRRKPRSLRPRSELAGERVNTNSLSGKCRRGTGAVAPVRSAPHVRSAFERLGRALTLCEPPQVISGDDAAVGELGYVLRPQVPRVVTGIRLTGALINQLVSEPASDLIKNRSGSATLRPSKRDVSLAAGLRLSPHTPRTSRSDLRHMTLTTATTVGVLLQLVDTAVDVGAHNATLSVNDDAAGAQTNQRTNRAERQILGQPVLHTRPRGLHTVPQAINNVPASRHKPLPGLREQVLNLAWELG